MPEYIFVIVKTGPANAFMVCQEFQQYTRRMLTNDCIVTQKKSGRVQISALLSTTFAFDLARTLINIGMNVHLIQV